MKDWTMATHFRNINEYADHIQNLIGDTKAGLVKKRNGKFELTEKGKVEIETELFHETKRADNP